MKRLIILCVLLLTFSAGAAEKVIEQQGSWSIIEQDNWSKPRYILSAAKNRNKFSLLCAKDIQKVIFNLYYFNIKRLNGVSLLSDLSIKLDNDKSQNDFWGNIFNNGQNAVLWGNYLDYIDPEQEKVKLIPIFSQLFKQFASASGNITFTAKGEGNTIYLASLSSEGLPVMFDHFAKYCGADFMTAFDIPVEEK